MLLKFKYWKRYTEKMFKLSTARKNVQHIYWFESNQASFHSCWEFNSIAINQITSHNQVYFILFHFHSCQQWSVFDVHICVCFIVWINSFTTTRSSYNIRFVNYSEWNYRRFIWNIDIIVLQSRTAHRFVVGCPTPKQRRVQKLNLVEASNGHDLYDIAIKR